jgi:diacylglycerol diphosphate phosphatase/phosphatidate phosphatase
MSVYHQSKPVNGNVAHASLLAFVSVGIPLLVLLPMSSFISKTKWDIHNAIIGMLPIIYGYPRLIAGLFMSYTMTGVVTQIVKVRLHYK